MPAGRRTWCLIVCLAFLAGCRRQELVENELRARDAQYREAIAELNRTEALANGLRLENDALRNGQNLSPETASLTFGVKKIVLGRATTGVDNDSVPGDEALQVWLEPHDVDEHSIKAPGSLQVYVFEINSQGQKVPLSSWEVDPLGLATSWKQGLLSTGYMLQFPWKIPPRTENLRVLARFILPDGRTFETDRDIKVKLLPGAAARPETTYGPDPVFRSEPLCPVAPTGAVRPAGNWQREPLHEALRLGAPQPAPPPEPGPGLFPAELRPSPDDVRVEN